MRFSLRINFLLIIFVFYFFTNIVFAFDGDIEITTSSNPTALNDEAWDVAVAPDGIYIVGKQGLSASNVWRIEKRDLNLQLLWATSTNLGFRADGVVADNSGVYIIGCTQSNTAWRIEKREPNGNISWVTSSASSAAAVCAYDAVVDYSGVYIVGTYYDSSFSTLRWRIEKRDLNNGALQWVVYSTFGSAKPLGVVLKDNYLYVGGYGFNASTGDLEWHIQKLTLSGSLVWSQWSLVSGSFRSGELRSIAVDSTGIYAVGYKMSNTSPSLPYWRVERWTIDGSRLWTTSTLINGQSAVPYDVAIHSSGLYIVGYAFPTSSSNPQWRIEKRDFNGDLLWDRSSDYSSGEDIALAINISGNTAYLVGFDRAPGNAEWRIEKRAANNFSPPDPSPPIDPSPPPAPPPPIIIPQCNLDSSPSVVKKGGTSTLEWQCTDIQAGSCVLSASPSSALKINNLNVDDSGSTTTASLEKTSQFRIECQDASSTPVFATTSVIVRSRRHIEETQAR